jgi:hypothetical protein
MMDNMFNLTQGAAAATSFRSPAALETLAGASAPVALIGLFPYVGEPSGRTELVLAPHKFTNRRLVYPPPPLVNRFFGWYDDILANGGGPMAVPTVQLASTILGPVVNGSFTNGHPDWATFRTALSTLGPDDLMDPLTGTTRAIQTALMVPLPLALVPQFLNHRRKPVDAAVIISDWVDANGHSATTTYLLNWLIMILLKGDPADVHGLAYRDVGLSSPIGDRYFVAWNQEQLAACLPGVHNASVAGGGPGAQVVTLMSDLIKVQQDARVEAQQARVAASTPKSIGDYFDTIVVGKLMALCNVANEMDLPDYWAKLASANGKRDREILEQAVHSVAHDLNFSELAPVVTSDLSKRIATLRLVGSNINDLGDGITPFLMVVQDYSSPSSEKAYFEALALAHDYDTLVAGDAAADLSDLKSLRSKTNVQVPTNFVTARLMLQGYTVILATILGRQHPLVGSLGSFLTQFQAREPFYINQVQQYDSSYGPGRLLRYVHLQTRWYMSSVWTAATPGTPVTSPDFGTALTKTMMGDMSWLPSLPVQYTTSPKASKHLKEGKEDLDDTKEKETKKKAQQVRNPKMNPRFEEFRSGINAAKFNDIIKKVGAPPNVQRNGASIPICASYHLRGNCFNNCGRKADHVEHTTAEDDQLYEWCKKAFA